MTSRERFLTVLRGEIPDRVPVTVFTVESGHFINQVYPDVDPWDVETLPLKVIELQKQLGVDVFVRLASGINEMLYLRMGGLNVSRQTEHWDVDTEEIRHGNTRIQRSTIKTPGGTLTQDCSITEIRPGTFVFACTKKPIKTPADLDLVMKYEPGIPESSKKAITIRSSTWAGNNSCTSFSPSSEDGMSSNTTNGLPRGPKKSSRP